jgi:N6-adenosine-specific RNA methylase IME4
MILYRTIAADNPWQFGDSGNPRGGTDHHYATMSLDRICAMRVTELAADGAHLWLWAPNAFVIDGSAAAVARAWGFVPKQLLTWCKDQIGPGRYMRNTTEQVLFCVRAPARKYTMAAMRTHFYAPRQAHSAKPDVFYTMYPETLGVGPRLELFARKRRAGWSSWGDECPGGIVIPQLAAA